MHRLLKVLPKGSLSLCIFGYSIQKTQRGNIAGDLIKTKNGVNGHLKDVHSHYGFNFVSREKKIRKPSELKDPWSSLKY